MGCARSYDQIITSLEMQRRGAINRAPPKETNMRKAYTIILAPNASIMTGQGTNSIVLGSGAEGATVIDPATDNPDYLDALVEEGKKHGGIRRILVTHGHHDHMDGAPALRERT